MNAVLQYFHEATRDIYKVLNNENAKYSDMDCYVKFVNLKINISRAWNLFRYLANEELKMPK